MKMLYHNKYTEKEETSFKNFCLQIGTGIGVSYCNKSRDHSTGYIYMQIRVIVKLRLSYFICVFYLVSFIFAVDMSNVLREVTGGGGGFRTVRTSVRPLSLRQMRPFVHFQ